MDKEHDTFVEKVDSAMKIVHEKLIQETKENNSYLVVSRNGKIVKLYAKDL